MVRSFTLAGLTVLLLAMSFGPETARANRPNDPQAVEATVAASRDANFLSSESATLLLVAGVLTGMAWFLRRPAA